MGSWVNMHLLLKSHLFVQYRIWNGPTARLLEMGENNQPFRPSLSSKFCVILPFSPVKEKVICASVSFPVRGGAGGSVSDDPTQTPLTYHHTILKGKIQM